MNTWYRAPYIIPNSNYDQKEPCASDSSSGVSTTLLFVLGMILGSIGVLCLFFTSVYFSTRINRSYRERVSVVLRHR